MRIGDFELLSDEGRDQAAAYFNANRDRAGAAKNLKDLQASFKKAEKALKDGSRSQEAVDAMAVEIGASKPRWRAPKTRRTRLEAIIRFSCLCRPMEYVGKGARFHWDFNPRGITEAQAGMIVAGLRRWANGIDTRSPCFFGRRDARLRPLLGGDYSRPATADSARRWRRVGTVRFDPKGLAPDRGRGDREMGAGME